VRVRDADNDLLPVSVNDGVCDGFVADTLFVWLADTLKVAHKLRERENEILGETVADDIAVSVCFTDRVSCKE
jgi:hypothetical protein